MHTHTDTALWTHTQKQVKVNLLKPENIKKKPINMQLLPCFSLNPELYLYACSGVLLHALFRHAISIRACAEFYSMQMHLLKDPI